MKTLFFLFALQVASFSFAQEKDVQLRFDKNIELLGYLVEMGDPAENNPEHPIYKIIHSHVEDRGNEHLLSIFELAADMDYGFLVHFMENLPEFPLEATAIETLIQERYTNETQEIKATYVQLVQMVNQFVLTSNFLEIYDNLAPHRTATLELLENNKPDDALLFQMEQFYQRSFKSYTIVPSLTVWPTAGFGGTKNNYQDAVFVLGPLEKNYNFTDGKAFEQLAIHEFGHAFVNDHVLKNEALIAKSENKFAPLQEAMYPQGYHNWKTCMIEHFVRAGEIIIPELMGNATSSEALMKEYKENRRFDYLPFIIERLKQYRLTEKNSYKQAVQKALLDLDTKN